MNNTNSKDITGEQLIDIAQSEWVESQLERIVAHSDDIERRVQAALALGASRLANAMLLATSRSRNQKITGRDRMRILAMRGANTGNDFAAHVPNKPL
jgi:LmbE family N-acetylglucosaminyl deacetylase